MRTSILFIFIIILRRLLSINMKDDISNHPQYLTSYINNY